MSVVVDANLIAALVLPLPYSEQAAAKVGEWKQSGVELHSPILLEYELASVLRKAIVLGLMTTEQAVETMHEFVTLNIHLWPATPARDASALRWAERLEHSKAYDAQYLALAEEIGCELWTADRRLAASAQRKGFDQVCLVTD